jgi:hypothetical protein
MRLGRLQNDHFVARNPPQLSVNIDPVHQAIVERIPLQPFKRIVISVDSAISIAYQAGAGARGLAQRLSNAVEASAEVGEVGGRLVVACSLFMNVCGSNIKL